ncbi:uncharacterized protein LOC114940170 isoform X2 [Nylanderia fulva]|uniref:uncharacterized protein LOC114940170 isoform X2 n=1 Tax=Nylanderia fulva TaxID=613905 RepID=UPI0010FB0843|nr:uncharacterized protein LOC114940170 isoform X2 [Nylanderia fulva]
MDDQRYMVCEFPNEEDSISIGYLEWLENKFTNIELDDVIKRGTIVKVRWPKDCDVGPVATTMKKKLANCQWEVVATKLRAYGGWIKMCEIRDNLEKYGITELDRSNRKQFTSKNNHTECDSNDESGVKETKKDAKQKKCILNVKKGKELLKQYKHKKQKYSSQNKSIDISDDESGEENEKSLIHKQSKSQLKDTVIVLNEENKRLRRDNERLRKLRFVNEDLPKIDKFMKDVTADLQCASWKTEFLNNQIDKLQQKVQAISNCIIEREQDYTPPPAMTLESDPIWISNKLDLPNNKLKSFRNQIDVSPATLIVQNNELEPIVSSDKLIRVKSSQRSDTDEFRESTSSRKNSRPGRTRTLCGECYSSFFVQSHICL